MKQLLKRIASIITAAAVAFSAVALPDTGILPGLAVTAYAETEISKLYVGGSAEVTTAGVIADTGASSGTASVSVEDGSVVLTLENFVYNGEGNSGYGSSTGNKLFSIYYEGSAPLIIDLIGTNSIIHDDAYRSNGYVFRGYKDLTIRSTNGSGSLTFSNTDPAYSASNGIYNNGNITFAGVTIESASNKGIVGVGGTDETLTINISGSKVTSSINTYNETVNITNGSIYSGEISELFNVENGIRTISDSTLNNATISNATITNSTITNSTISGSTISGSTIDSETVIKSSTVTNSTVGGEEIAQANYNENGSIVYTVNFDLKGASGSIDSQTILNGEKAAAPTNPTRTGYTFKGWYENEACTGDPFDFENTTITGNTTLYAKWLQHITYIGADGTTQTCEDYTLVTSSDDDVELSAGTYVVSEEYTEVRKITLTGDVDLIVCNDCNLIVNNNSYYQGSNITGENYTLNVFAQKKKPDEESIVGGINAYNCTVKSLNVYGGGISLNNNLTAESYIQKCGFINVGEVMSCPSISLDWSSSSDHFYAEAFEGTPNITFLKNLCYYVHDEGYFLAAADNITGKTLYPAYKVTFDVNYQGGVNILKGVPADTGKVTAPTAPTREGYTFGGWYTTSDCEAEFDFANTVITEDTTIYGKWRTNLTADNVTAAELTYNGEVQTNILTVKVGEVTLTAGTDYTVTYSPAEVKNAGTYTANITSKGDYAGTVAKTFTVAPKEVTAPTIELDPAPYVYDGTAKTPAATVKDGETVIPASEYTVSYSDNTNAGTATVTITDNENGNYTVSGSTTFEITETPATVTTAPTAKTLTYTGTAQALVEAGTATGGTIQYKLGTDGAYGATIPTATNAGTYTVYYKAVGDDNHSDSAETSVEVTIAKASVTVRADNKTKEFGATDPALTATVTGLVNSESESLITYTLSRVSGETKGTYTITPFGDAIQGNYYVTFVNGTLTITKKAITPEVTITGTYTYTGTAITPIFTVKNGENELPAAEYTTALVNNTNAGTATLTVKAATDGNYSFADIQTDFAIGKAETALTVTIADWEYGTTASTPSVSGNAGNGAVSYTYSSDGSTFSADVPTAVGDYTIKATVAETTNYLGGETTTTFKITKTLAKVTTAPTAKTLTYNGAAQELVKAGVADTSMEYSTDGTTWSAAIPTGTNAKDYTVYYRAAADTDHDASEPTTVTATIGKATLTITGATATGRAYNGLATVTVTAVTLSGIIGTDDVSVNAASLTGELASADAGDYTLVTLPDELTLTGTDKENYKLTQPTAPVATTVTISKATPTITVETAAYSKTYGDAAFAIEGCTASISGVTLTYAVTAGTDVISLNGATVTILKNGSATVTVSIPETTNYTATTADITVTVAKADSPKTKPQTTISAANDCETVGAVALPTGWVWQDGTTTLEVGTPVNAVAEYTGADADCYNNTTVTVTITRADHVHTAGTPVHENVTAATCTTGGSYDEIIRCTECNEIISSTHITTDPLGHTPAAAVRENEVAATCTAAGSYDEVVYCSVCGAEISRTAKTAPALGHDYTSEVTTPATCAAAGVRTYTCSRCGDTYTEAIPALSHSYTTVRENEIAATCTTAGSYDEVVKCSNCGDVQSRPTRTTAALGHNYVSAITTAETCTTAGVRTYTCSRCGDSYTETIAALGHNYVNDRCTRCGAIDPNYNGGIGGGGYTPVFPSGGGSTNTTETTTNSTTDNKEPTIEGSGESGWTNIIDAVEDAKDGDTVTVDMNGATVVPEDLISEIKGKDVDIVLDMGDGIKWTINGKDVTGDVGDIDLSVTVGTSEIPTEVINNVSGEHYNTVISLAHNGEFGFIATLTIDMRKQDAGLYANLFYYNKQTKTLEFVSSGIIREDGSVDLEFTHASDYTIVVDDHPLGSRDVTAKTNGNKVKLNWDAIPDAEKYVVYYKKNGKYKKLTTVSNTALTVTGLKNGKEYEFLIRYSVDGKLSEIAESYKISVTAYYKPAPKLTAGKGYIRITWDKVENATAYRVYKYVNGKLKLLTEVKDLAAIRLTNTKAGKEYTFAVKAYVNGEWTKVYKTDLVSITAK